MSTSSSSIAFSYSSRAAILLLGQEAVNNGAVLVGEGP